MKRIWIVIALIGGVLWFAGCRSSEHDSRQHSASTAGAVEHYTCPMHPSVKSDKPGKCPICGMDLTPVARKKEAAVAADYYTCPMHPSVKSDKPGQCPICGMDLTKVARKSGDTEAQDPHAGHLQIDPTKQQLIGVRYAEVQRRQLDYNITAVGRVQYDERRVADINLKFMGWITRLFADYEGQYVRSGDPLFEIYSPNLVATQEELLLALRSGGPNNQDAADNIRERLRLWGLTGAQISDIEQRGKSSKELPILSPVSGHIIMKDVVQGSSVMAGMMLYRIADLSVIWVMVDVYEQDVPLLKTGQQASFSLSYLPSETLTGRVRYIYPILDEMSRTMKVRLEFANSGLKLKPGMFGTASIRTSFGERLVVPRDAILDTGERQVVFVDQGSGYLEPRMVHTGQRTADFVEVLQGLQVGERVVSSARFLIDSESTVQGVLEQMGGAAHRH